MRILFMGTPEISATALGVLINGGENVIAVVTREDKPRGRGNVMTPTPVKTLALENGIPTYTPTTLKDEAFSDLLSELAPDLIIVVAYGKILPESVINYPKYGCINLHVSLLPKYRGAAPMQRAIMEGESETGVTIMYMDEGLDTGDIVLTERFPIDKKDNFETIHDKSAEIGGNLMLRALTAIENGTATREKQNDSLATYAKKIEKSEAKIDLSRSASRLDPIIRGLTPIPGAYLMQNGKMLKISEAEAVSGSGELGEVIAVDDKGTGSFTVACGDGALKVFKIKPEGKGVMTAGDFIRGRKISKGDILN